jgi:hypothetical protein
MYASPSTIIDGFFLGWNSLGVFGIVISLLCNVAFESYLVLEDNAWMK